MKENKNFLKHFMVIGGGTVINMVIGLITTPLITRLVDPVEYGQYSIFTMYANIAVMVLCLGLDQALVRFFYEDDSEAYKSVILFKCVKLPLVASCITSGIIIVVAVTGIYQFEFSAEIMVWLCLYVVARILYRFSSLVVRLQYHTKLFSALHVLNRLLYLLIAIPLLHLIHGKSFLCLAIAITIPEILCYLVSFVAQKKIWIFSHLNFENVKILDSGLLKYAFPFIISMGITTLFQAIDKMSLNYFCTYAEVGIYSSTMTLVNIFAIIQTTFNTVWAPMQTEHYAKNPEDRSFYQQGNQIITVLMFSLGVCLILVKDVFAILLGEKYREAAYILPFLIFNPIMYTVSETTVGGINFMKKSNLHIIVAVGACVTNIIGNTILVPKLGCRGAAISTGVSYIVFFTLRTMFSNKYYYTDFRLGKFYVLTLIVSAYALYNTFVKFNLMSILGWGVCMLAIVALYKDTVVWGISYLRATAQKLFGKVKR